MDFVEDSSTPQGFNLGLNLGIFVPHNRVALFAFNTQFWNVYTHAGHDKLRENSHDCVQYQRCNSTERNKKGA